MSSIMLARNGRTGRGEVSEVIGALSRAEGCWTFDARDRTPRSSRATAHHLVENAPIQTRAPSRASGFVLRRTGVIGDTVRELLAATQLLNAIRGLTPFPVAPSGTMEIFLKSSDSGCGPILHWR